MSPTANFATGFCSWRKRNGADLPAMKANLNRNKYKITIHDIHTVDGESSDTTMTVFGNMEPQDNGYRVSYIEQSGEMEGCLTEVIFEDNTPSVAIRRRGSSEMELLLEKGKRHNCVYDVPEGRLIMGIDTRKIQSSMDRGGGTLDLIYDVDFNAGFVSQNTLQISVKEIF